MKPKPQEIYVIESSGGKMASNHHDNPVDAWTEAFQSLGWSAQGSEKLKNVTWQEEDGRKRKLSLRKYLFFGRE